MLKIKLNMFMEDHPTDTSIERTPLHVDDVIILGHQGEVWSINLDDGTASLMIKPPLHHITSLSPHPVESLAYVISDRNKVTVIDYKKQRMLLTKPVETTQVLNPTPRKASVEEVCRRQFTPTDLNDMKNNQDVTCVLSLYKFGITLLLCGFKNGMLWVLDQYLTVQYSPKYTPVSSKVTDILSNEINTLVAVSYHNGMISVYDIRSPTRLQVVAVYKAHEQVTQIIFDNVTETGVTIASIGTHRLVDVRTIRRKSSGNTVNAEKKSDPTEINETPDSNDKYGNTVTDSDEEKISENWISGQTSGNSVNSNEGYEFGNVAIRRVEQFANLLFIVSVPSEYFVKDNIDAHSESISDPSLYLIGTDQYKYRFLLKSNLTCIKTIQGPLLRSPVVNFKVLPDFNCALITTHSEIGFQKLPLSGLPHEYIYFTLPLSTEKIFLTPGRETLISIGGGGKDNDFLSVWKIDPASIRTHNPSSRHALEPYYSLVQGGYRGEEFKKIENTFVYFTIEGACQDFINKQACLLLSSDLPSRSTIDLCHLPYILSALGVFPSEFDLRLLNVEIHLMGLTELDFAHFLVLYLNHRPVKAVSFEEVLAAVKYFAADSSKIYQMYSKQGTSCQRFARRIFANDKHGESSSSSSGTTSSSSVSSTGSQAGTNIRFNLDRTSKSSSGSGISSDASSVSSSGSTSSSSSSINIARLLRNRSRSPADTWMTKDTLVDVLTDWGEVKYSEESAEQLVDFLFGGDEKLDVMEVTARLVEPETVIKLDEIDEIRVYTC
uniref:WD repeat-containing protein 66 n=1 Tax=Cacopsylla melanoneura TaxID=428564 RepID=A0A8D9AAQ9_9HEMI